MGANARRANGHEGGYETVEEYDRRVAAEWEALAAEICPWAVGPKPVPYQGEPTPGPTKHYSLWFEAGWPRNNVILSVPAALDGLAVESYVGELMERVEIALVARGLNGALVWECFGPYPGPTD